MRPEEFNNNRHQLILASDSAHSLTGMQYQLALPGTPDFAADNDTIDLSEIWLTLRKYKWFIIGITVLVVAAAVIDTLLMRPVYQSTTTIQIRPTGPQILEYQDLGLEPSNQLSQKNFYQTQYEILRSRYLAGKVIDELNLIENPEINGAIGQRSLVAGVNYLINMIKNLVANSDAGEESNMASGEKRERAIDRFLDKLSVTPVQDSELVKVGFESFDTNLAAQIANTLAEKYIQSNIQRHQEAVYEAREFLQNQLFEMQNNLEQADQSLQDFAEREEIADLSERIELANKKLDSLESKLTEVQQEKVAFKVKHDQIKKGGGGVLPEIVDSNLINTLQEELIQRRAEHSQLLARFKSDYPDVKILSNRIEKLETQIASEKNRIKESIVEHYEGLSQQEEAIKNSIREQEAALLALNQHSVEYNFLKRDVEANRELYEGLLQRMKEVSVASGAHENKVSMIDMAVPALSPYKPDMRFNVIMALVLGSVAGTGLAFFLRFLDNTVRRPEDVEPLVYLPTLGVIPQISKHDRKSDLVTPETLSFYCVNRPESSESEAYHSLCFSLMCSSQQGMPQTLVVTSPNPMDGKTTIACNLACILAKSGKRTLLVDADFRRPRIHRLFRQSQSPGLAQRISVYSDQVQSASYRCLYTSMVENLYVMTSGTIPRNPSEQLAPDRVRNLFNALEKLFDHIIIDSAPVMGLADVLSLSRAADGVLLVTSSGETTKTALKLATQRLHQIHAHVLGVVINNADLESPEYSQYYRNYYTHASLLDNADVIEASINGQIDQKRT